MPQGQNICGYSSCNAAISSNLMEQPPCSDCRDVPDSDLHGPCTDYSYCSQQHLLLDHLGHHSICRERVLKRTLIRVASLGNMVFMCNKFNLFFFHIVDRPPGHPVAAAREVFIEHSNGPRGRTQWWAEGSQPADILGAPCFDNCINAIILQTPLLAWMLEGLPVKVLEVTAMPIKTMQTHMWEEINNVWIQQPIAIDHDFVTLTPTIFTYPPADGIVLDSSAMQYENTIRTHTASEYYQYRVVPGSDTSWPFGCHLRRYLRSRSGSQPADDAQVFEAGMRAGNNALYRWAQELGGLHNLFTMSHGSFSCAQDGLGRLLCKDLRYLRCEMDQIFSNAPEISRDLQELVWNYGGKGHAMMMKACPN